MRLPLVYKSFQTTDYIMQQGQVENNQEDKYDYLVFNSANTKTKCYTPCLIVQILQDHPPPHTHTHTHKPNNHAKWFHFRAAINYNIIINISE